MLSDIWDRRRHLRTLSHLHAHLCKPLQPPYPTLPLKLQYSHYNYSLSEGEDFIFSIAD